MRVMGLFLFALAACGGGGGGEDIAGTITFEYGSTHIVPDTGVALQDDRVDPESYVIMLGDLDIDCDFLDSRVRDGTFLTIQLPLPPAAGMSTSFVFMTHIEDQSASTNGTTSDVTITTVGDRIAGMVTFSTTDDEVGAITASGTFDVFSCL